MEYSKKVVVRWVLFVYHSVFECVCGMIPVLPDLHNTSIIHYIYYSNYYVYSLQGPVAALQSFRWVRLIAGVS